MVEAEFGAEGSLGSYLERPRPTFRQHARHVCCHEGSRARDRPCHASCSPLSDITCSVIYMLFHLSFGVCMVRRFIWKATQSGILGSHAYYHPVPGKNRPIAAVQTLGSMANSPNAANPRADQASRLNLVIKFPPPAPY